MMKEELLERIEKMTGEEDFESYLFISDKGVSTNADYVTAATLLTTLMKNLLDNGFDVEDLHKAVKLAQMNEKEMLSELKEKLEKLLGEE